MSTLPIGETGNQTTQMLVFEEGEKAEFPEKNLSAQSREPTNSVHL